MSVTLLLGVHAHQPVGNFPEVMADAHERCYRPFLETLFNYPEFRFSAHFSGWMLDWLRLNYPDDMALLATMVRRGQVELFSSGDTEPVLAAIPHRDRVGQLRTLNDKLTHWAGRAPEGAWLTERVWESSVVPALGESGIRYVTVDDYHFLCAGRRPEELDGYFSTEEGGARLDLFPISEALRYRLPFSPAHDAVAWLEQQADVGREAAIYFDDIEKFGIWPETYDWVYTRGWLRQFVEGVLASPKIETACYGDFHTAHESRGVVYLPTTSYSEMNEWTLPAPAARTYANLLAQEKNAGRGDLHRPFLRGGIWRNFMSRYPEANWMHKRMLQLSARLAALPRQPQELTDMLYRAQANDAYWHGLFGGLYLPHLRRAVWNNLAELEGHLDRIDRRPNMESGDFDLDGKRETLAHDARWQIAVRDDGYGAVHELTCYPLRHNFADTLCRYHEAYHDKISQTAQEHHGDGIASAHDIVRCKHPIGPEDIVADSVPRAIWIDRLNGQALADYQPSGPLAFERAGISKRYILIGDLISLQWRISGMQGKLFSTTLNLAMPSCDGFLGRYRLADDSEPCGFGQELDLPDAELLTLTDGVLDGSLRIAWNEGARVCGRPHFTVSQSEAGFEKIMQAAEIRLEWEIPTDDFTIALQVTTENYVRPSGTPSDE